ncbi:MAG: ADP-ribose pyrophosphatase, partial [Patescibacteria group bacterium]|nr:ADP-ribose pyrophosphatase [Patescibacteria group bacterium]
MKKWIKLSEKVILDHPRLSISEDTVKLPNGHITKYVRYDNAPDGTQIIAFNEEGKILLQKEYSYPPNVWLFQFPGGKIDDGEMPEEGAKREFAEETKFIGKMTCLGWFYTDNRRMDAKFYVFIATDLIESKVHDQDIEEDFEYEWKSEEEIDHMIGEGKIPNYSI